MKFRMQHVASMVAVMLALTSCTLPGVGLRELTVMDGEVQVTAPPGYCIDKDASVSLGPAVVVMIGRCTYGGEAAAAVLTLTIGAPASAGVLIEGPNVLGAFFTSTPGRRILARDGNPGHVQILQQQIAGNSLLLHLNDRVSGDYWRAITAIKGRLVTISAAGTAQAPLTAAQGLALVQDMMRLLVQRNGGGPASYSAPTEDGHSR
jgi:hypothetical protein